MGILQVFLQQEDFSLQHFLDFAITFSIAWKEK